MGANLCLCTYITVIQMWQPHAPDYDNLLVATNEENKNLIEISCFVIAKSRTKPMSITWYCEKNPQHARTAPRCFILFNCFANFQIMRKGWDGGELRGWTGRGLGNPYPSARFRLQFQIVQPATMWDLDSFCRAYYWKVLKCVLIQGPPKVKWRLLQPPARKQSAPLQVWVREETLTL